MARILVVDDEASIRGFLDLLLRDAGHSTVLAQNGVEALAAPGSFDLLLTDLMMPRMRGDELVRQMRQRDPDLKVLYLTAYSDQLLKGKDTFWKGEAYVDKPASPQGVLDTVDMLLNGQFDVSVNCETKW
jgi:CheY-like chemotaxis protein